MNAAEFSARCRRIADKIDQYINRFGYKTGWDAGLHGFMDMLEPTEDLIDEKLENAADGAKITKVRAALANPVKELIQNGVEPTYLRGILDQLIDDES